MLHIQTLGGLAVTADGRPLTGAAGQPRRLALLAMLARAGDRGVNRDRLIASLWPDVEEERARRNLTHALYALRRDLGDEDAIEGAKELRLADDRIESDVREFTDAIAQGRLAHAASVYGGPFLDGFRLPGVAGFERWAEDERDSLQRQFAETLETLARRAGDPHEAAGWWRRLGGLDPLNSRFAIGLMEALAATGDVAGALRHARVHETLVAEQLELPADGDVLALAQRLRERDAAPVVRAEAAPAPNVESPPTAPTAPTLPATPPPVASTSIERAQRRWRLIAAGGVVLAAALFALSRVQFGAAAEDGAAGPVLAVGQIVDRRGGGEADLTGALADMLATNLAHSSAVRVVSTARMYELSRPSAGGDNEAAMLDVARRAGATELVDGALFALADGTLRLDLRRVDIVGGVVRSALSVKGADLFALADSGTVALLAGLGAPVRGTSIAAVTTSSLTAYRLYEQGLRAWSTGRPAEAAPLFAASLVEDSTFALAAFYYARSVDITWSESVRLMDRAKRLSERATARERLAIGAGWARLTLDPSLVAYADSLMTRFPDEVDGYLAAGQALLMDGRPTEALVPLQRVVTMDSSRLAGDWGTFCNACEALFGIAEAYRSLDSLPAAERTARRWVGLQAQSPLPWHLLAELLAVDGRLAEALDAASRASSLDNKPGTSVILRLRLLIHAGEYDQAAMRAREELMTASKERRSDLLWLLGIAEREAGRFDSALVAARLHRAESAERANAGSVVPAAALEAAILIDHGQPRAAAALFDSIARWTPEATSPSPSARHAWMLTQVATALVQAGDTTRLAQLADSVRALGAGSGLRRNRVLHDYITGLRLSARGDWPAAEAAYRRALLSPSGGYTRVNLELARALEAQGRRGDARALLSAAMRGSFDGSGLYVSQRELRRRLETRGP